MFKFISVTQKLTFKCSLVLALSLGILLPLSPAQAAPTWTSNEPSWPQQGSAPAASQPAYTRQSSSSVRRTRNVTPFSPGSNNISIDLGQVFLMGDLGTNYSDNLGFRFHYTYGVSDLFAFDSAIEHSSHSDGNFSVTSLTTGLRANLAWYDRVVPYGVFGLGFYRPSYQVSQNEDASASINTLLFGLHMGPGVNLLVTEQFYFGSSLTFHNIFSSTKKRPDGKVQDVGGTYTSFMVHAGISL